MSVDVKTPTRTQFEHTEFQCGEKQSPRMAGLNTGDQLLLGNCDKYDDSGERRRHSDTVLRLDDSGRLNIGQNELKPEEVKLTQGGQQYRKRRFSQHQKSYEGNLIAKKGRRHSTRPSERIILPTKFLLGGNINDPLNLNSLNDEEISRVLNERTPHSSPLPIPMHRRIVQIVLPLNITDPLNLNSSEECDITLMRKKKRVKHKKRPDLSLPIASRESVDSKEVCEALKIVIDEQSSLPPEVSSVAEHLSPEASKSKIEDKIVSPVIPQKSPKVRRRKRTTSETKVEISPLIGTKLAFQSDVSPECGKNPKRFQQQTSHSKQPQKPQNQKNKSQYNKFEYGNYNRYYGYRNAEVEKDYRLECFNKDWFEGKDCLDIGCNVGHVTLALARDANPHKIIGIDIDGKLIAAARKNIRHYLSTSSVDTDRFPVSNALNYGPIIAPPLSKLITSRFPQNVLFMQSNYVLDSDALLDLEREKYDTILLLSVSKWMHLNCGDAGMKRAFKRIYRQLRPGGRLVLEPQGWPSYKKKKKLTDVIFQNYQSIKLRPEQFTEYLLSREVGFSKCETINVPFNKSKGFRRPIMLYTKSDTVANSPRTESLDIPANRSNKPRVGTEELSSTKKPTEADVSDDAQSQNRAVLALDSEKEENEDKNNLEANQNSISHNISPMTSAVIQQSLSSPVIPLQPIMDPTEMSLVSEDNVESAFNISNEGPVSSSPNVQEVCEDNRESS